MKIIKKWIAGFLVLSFSLGSSTILPNMTYATTLPTGDMNYIESVEPIEIIDISNLATASDILYASASDASVEDGDIIDDLSTDSNAYEEALHPRLYADGYNYAKLNTLRQNIYEGMLELVHTGSSSNRILIASGAKNSISTRDVMNSFFALCYDHPELFWLWQRSIQNGSTSETSTVTSPFRVLRVSSNGGRFYEFYMSLKEDKTADDIHRMQELDATVQEMIGDMANEYGDLASLPPAALALIAHDALLEKVTYHTAASFDHAADDAHTAYGALVHGLGVCDGYALGYVYLLNALGIDATMITGNGNGSGHAWTAVRLPDKQNTSAWYEVDATWNDTIASPHTFFNLTTAQMRANRHIRIPNTNAYNVDLMEFTTQWPTANATHFTYSYVQNVGEILEQTDTYGRNIAIYRLTQDGMIPLENGQSFHLLQVAPAANVQGDIDSILWSLESSVDTRLVEVDAWSANKPYLSLKALQNGDINITLYLIFDNGDRVSLSTDVTAVAGHGNGSSSSTEHTSTETTTEHTSTETTTEHTSTETTTEHTSTETTTEHTSTETTTEHTSTETTTEHTSTETTTEHTSTETTAEHTSTETTTEHTSNETTTEHTSTETTTEHTSTETTAEHTSTETTGEDTLPVIITTTDSSHLEIPAGNLSVSSGSGGGGRSRASRSSIFSGLSLTASKTKSGTWLKDQNGWWYKHTDGTYSTNTWEYINGSLYHFNSRGYALSGWAYLYSSADRNYRWYYMHPTGLQMMTGWVQVDNKWYYLQSNGTLLTNTTTPDGYKVDANGVWIP